MRKIRSLTPADQCLVHRYLYYVIARPVISDREYDDLERIARQTALPDHAIHRPGSDNPASYPTWVRKAAIDTQRRKNGVCRVSPSC